MLYISEVFTGQALRSLCDLNNMILTSSYYVSYDYINTFQNTVEHALRDHITFEILLTYAIDQKYIYKIYKIGSL